MRQPDLSKWDIKESTNGLLFFGLLVDELLFHFTIDSFKLPAVDAHILCYELMHALYRAEEGSLKRGAIEPIIEELCTSMQKDPVAKEIFKTDLDCFIKEIKKEKALEKKTAIATLMINKCRKEYFEKCKQMLREEVKTGKRKEIISRLTRIYLNELTSEGYSAEHIYFTNNSFFFESNRSPSKIDRPELIDGFFKRCETNAQEWHAIFRVSNKFKHIKEFAEKIHISIKDDNPFPEVIGERGDIDKFLGDKKEYPLYLEMNNIEANDTFSARTEAENRIFSLDTMGRYHVHKKVLSWYDGILIYTKDKKHYGLYTKTVAPMFMRPDKSLKELGKLIREISSITVREKLSIESAVLFGRALQLHRTALDSQNKENQLLNLWTAIEVLFPSQSEDGCKIEHIIENMTPFIVKAYVAKLVSYVLSAVKAIGKQEAENIINKVDVGDNLPDKCTALLSIEEYEPIIEELFRAIGNNPLLINRITYLHGNFEEANEIRRMIEAHTKRVSWHIRRMYRMRNMIVHSKTVLPYLDILIENLHSYVDRIFELICEAARHNEKEMGIEDISMQYNIELKNHLLHLERNKGEKCTKDNYKKLLYGNL